MRVDECEACEDREGPFCDGCGCCYECCNCRDTDCDCDTCLDRRDLEAARRDSLPLPF